MSPFLIIVALMLPCIAALLASRYAKNVWATQLLLWGGAIFLIAIFLSVVFDQQCRGSALEGWIECQPSFLVFLANGLRQPLLLLVLGYFFIGPIIVITAATLEFLGRSRKT